MTFQSFKSLQRQVEQILLLPKTDSNSIKVIKLCRDFITKNNQTSSTYNSKTINDLVKYRKPDVEKYLFDKLNIPTQSISVRKSYIVERPVPASKYIYETLENQSNEMLNRIALRQLLYKNKDLETPMHIMQKNHDLYRERGIERLQRFGVAYFFAVLTFHGILEFGVRGQEAIHVLFDVYFLNLFFLTFLFDGSSKSELVAWRPGKSTFHRYFFALEFQLCSKYMTIYKELFTTNVSNFHNKDCEMIKSFQSDLNQDHVVDNDKFIHTEFRKLGLLIPKDKKEQMFKEYWDTSGDGFEWVEPDKDPVEFLDITDPLSKR